MKHISEIRKEVCTIANRLRAAGYTGHDAFKAAWRRVQGTTFRAVGVMADNRQSMIEYLRRFNSGDLRVGLRREAGNQYDANAVQVLVKIESEQRYGVLGYLPRGLAAQIAPVMDKGVTIRAKLLQIIGGGDFNNGLLLSLAV